MLQKLNVPGVKHSKNPKPEFIKAKMHLFPKHTIAQCWWRIKDRIAIFVIRRDANHDLEVLGTLRIYDGDGEDDAY